MTWWYFLWSCKEIGEDAVIDELESERLRLHGPIYIVQHVALT